MTSKSVITVINSYRYIVYGNSRNDLYVNAVSRASRFFGHNDFDIECDDAEDGKTTSPVTGYRIKCRAFERQRADEDETNTTHS